jgi:nitronate monooxygenase
MHEAETVGRRDVLSGLAIAAGASALAAPDLGPPAVGRAAFLRTRLCTLLGIEVPVIQAPMAGVVTPELVAGVGEAGGLGILPGTGLAPEELRQKIRATRALGPRPFGVNPLLHPGIRRPADPASLPQAAVDAAQGVLNRFRERLGLAPRSTPPPALDTRIDEAIEVVIEERVAVFSIGLGKPEPALVHRFRERGVKLIAMAATPADAVELEAAGVDAIVAQGSEAGGHRSTWIKRPSGEEAAIGTLALVPQVAGAVRVPVIAAGGIMDGRGLLAALALGAEGVLMGTRFIATRESGAPRFYKQALIDGDSDRTTLTDAFTGLWARVLRNEYTEAYRASGAAVLPALLQQALASDVTTAAASRGDGSLFPLYAGQGVGLVDDAGRSARDLVQDVAAEARRRLLALRDAVA